MKNHQNVYQRWHITPEATKAEIQFALKRQINQVQHSFLSKEEQQEQIDILLDLYNMLLDPAQKEQYDHLQGVISDERLSTIILEKLKQKGFEKEDESTIIIEEDKIFSSPRAKMIEAIRDLPDDIQESEKKQRIDAILDEYNFEIRQVELQRIHLEEQQETYQMDIQRQIKDIQGPKQLIIQLHDLNKTQVRVTIKKKSN